MCVWGCSGLAASVPEGCGSVCFQKAVCDSRDRQCGARKLPEACGVITGSTWPFTAQSSHSHRAARKDKARAQNWLASPFQLPSSGVMSLWLACALRRWLLGAGLMTKATQGGGRSNFFEQVRGKVQRKRKGSERRQKAQNIVPFPHKEGVHLTFWLSFFAIFPAVQCILLDMWQPDPTHSILKWPHHRFV